MSTTHTTNDRQHASRTPTVGDQDYSGPNVTRLLATFVAQTAFDDLPSSVVHETKRILLDIVGCAIGALNTKKGKIAIDFASAMGGPPQASILGTREKVAITNAAFANGELMHGLDHCAVLPPNHITAHVTPAALALAESNRASGRALIAAVAVAHEVACRVGLSMEGLRAHKGGAVAPVWGLGFDQFGAAAGAGSILGLDADAMSDALGLAGFFAPVPSHNKFLLTPESASLAKYGPAGWIAQGGVTAASLASKGYRGDRTVLEGEFGFWAMSASNRWDPTKITTGLGREWNLLRVIYKRWPCCGVFQSPLGALTTLLAENDLKVEEIDQVIVENEPHGMLPRFEYSDLEHHVDAQFNLSYNLALVAHRVKVSGAWQSERYLNDPSVRGFMRKVIIKPYAKAEEARHQELAVEGREYIDRRPSRVEVHARGKQYVNAVEYASWLSHDNPTYRATDNDLADKFRANASEILASAEVERAIDSALNLENIDDVGAFIAPLSAPSAATS